MGCDIHLVVEVRRDGTWRRLTDEVLPADDWDRESSGKTYTSLPFSWRSYTMFGLFADVRNHDGVPPIAQRRGLPADADPDTVRYLGADDDFLHSGSWLSLTELLAYDYGQSMAHPRGEDGPLPVRDFFGDGLDDGESIYFQQLKAMAALVPDPDDVRIVFAFDN